MPGDTRSRNRLVGKIDARQLRAAAKEQLRAWEQNQRKHDYDQKHVHLYEQRECCWYIVERTSSGWRAYTVEDICGQGPADVRRELEENLEPAIRYEVARLSCIGGRFNTWCDQPEKNERGAFEHFRDKVDFRVADRYVGKVTAQVPQ